MRGGARPGAGRPKGSRDKTAEARKLMEDHAAAAMAGMVVANIAKMSPLEVILHAMTLAASAGAWDKAGQFAALAAPYCHPKLSSVDMRAVVNADASSMTDEQLLALVGRANVPLLTAASAPDIDEPVAVN